MTAPADAVGPARTTTSASGARIERIATSEAVAWLERHAEGLSKEPDDAWGASEDNGTLIGVAALAAGERHCEAIVAVVPARRRLKVGGDLLHALLEEARAREQSYLGCTPRGTSSGAAEFLRAQGLVVSRRTADGTVRVVALIPSAAHPPT